MTKNITTSIFVLAGGCLFATTTLVLYWICEEIDAGIGSVSLGFIVLPAILAWMASWILQSRVRTRWTPPAASSSTRPDAGLQDTA